MVDPIITWSLILTAFVAPLSVALLGFSVSRMFKRRDERDDEITKLKTDLGAEKEKALREWRSHHTDVLCKVKTTVENIDAALNQKVDRRDCERESKDQWDAINKLRERHI